MSAHWRSAGCIKDRGASNVSRVYQPSCQQPTGMSADICSQDACLPFVICRGPCNSDTKSHRCADSCVYLPVLQPMCLTSPTVVRSWWMRTPSKPSRTRSVCWAQSTMAATMIGSCSSCCTVGSSTGCSSTCCVGRAIALAASKWGDAEGPLTGSCSTWY